jgi:anaerobic magnesium-protoporphyrin IX monomethyl ester cyclase
MDVILINPSYINAKYLSSAKIAFPQGLMHLAAVLCQKGYKTIIIDEVLESNPYRTLLNALQTKPICVGIGTATGSQIDYAIKFADFVRNNSDVPIVWGGAHPTILPEQTLKDDLVDIVVIGEGENSFLELVAALKNGNPIEQIRGICFKDKNGIHINPPPKEVDLERMPPLPFDLVNMEAYISSIKKRKIRRGFGILTSRGCPFACYFCHNSIKKSTWRYKSATKIISEIKYLKVHYNIDGILIEDENFFVSKKRVIEFCNMILNDNIKLTIRAGGIRVDQFASFDKSLLKLLKRAGFDHFSIGIESGSPRTLKIMNKNITLDQIYKTNKNIRRYKFAVTYNFMSGVPGEDLKDFAETLKMILFLLRTNKNLIAPVGIPKFFFPYPKTVLSNKCIAYGYKPMQTFRDWGRYDYIKTLSPWRTKTFENYAIEAMQIVKNLQDRFIGENANITENDFHPLISLINRILSV